MDSTSPSKKLLVDDDEGDVNLELAVNKEYASRFEHNMQRARWDRLKSTNPRLAAKIEAKASGDILGSEEAEESESSSDEEEDDGDEALHYDEDFFSVLSKIRNRDKSIYDSQAKLFPDEPSEEGSEQEAPAAKERPALLKDVLARQALMGEESTSDEEDNHDRPSGPTYVEEQEQYRRSFLQEADKALAAEGDGDDEFGGVLKKQKKGSGPAEGLGPDRDPKGAAEQTQQLLDAYFGKDDQLAEDERFLKQYMLNKGWMDRGDEALPTADDIEEDEEYLEQAERFEARYNHRFEEPGAGNVITYPRNLEGVVRKADDRRRTARSARAERKAAEAAALEEEVKRRKAEKRRELDQRLERIKDASGSPVANKMLMKMLGKQDFDIEEYDRAMAAAFDDSYYEAEDEELDAPAVEAGSDAADEPDLEDLPEIDADEDEDEPGRRLSELKGERAELAQMVEDYQKLDAEDYVGGMPTRFRYREVAAASYGLNILEVLAAPEKDLNQVVGMKKLAPYREDGGLVRPNYAKLRQMQEESEVAAQRKKQRSEKGKKAVRPQVEQQPEIGDAPGGGDAGGKLEAAATGPSQHPKMRKATVAEAPAPAKPQKASKKLRMEEAYSDAGRTGNKKQRRHQADLVPADDALDSKESQQRLHGAHKDEQAAAELQQSRLATFAKPTLAKPKKRKGKKRKDTQQPAAPAAEQGSQLTKAQRKNLWRQKRRAQLKQE